MTLPCREQSSAFPYNKAQRGAPSDSEILPLVLPKHGVQPMATSGWGAEPETLFKQELLQGPSCRTAQAQNATSGMTLAAEPDQR